MKKSVKRFAMPVCGRGPALRDAGVPSLGPIPPRAEGIGPSTINYIAPEGDLKSAIRRKLVVFPALLTYKSYMHQAAGE